MNLIAIHIGADTWFKDSDYPILKGETLILRRDVGVVEVRVNEVCVMNGQTHIYVSKVREFNARILLPKET